MGVRKRGTQYYAQVESDGERKYATFPTKAMANAWILQEKSAFARNKGEPKSDRSITLRTVLERYVKEHLPKNKSGEVDALRLNAFINSCKFIDTAVVDLKASDFVAWRDQRLKLRASSTVARDLNCIRAALNLARDEWEWDHPDVLRKVKQPSSPPARTRLVGAHEVVALCRHFQLDDDTEPTKSCHRAALVMIFALETGMRAGEICSLRWANVDLQSRVATVLPEESKSGIGREVGLSPRAHSVLIRLRAYEQRISKSGVTADTLVFGWKRESLSRTFRRATAKLGLSDIHFHDTRHTAVTNLSKRLSPFEMARMVGHSDPKMTLRYYNESAASIAQKLARAEAVTGGWSAGT